MSISDDTGTDDLLLAACYTEFKECLERAPTWTMLNNCHNNFSGKQVFIALTDRLTDKISSLQRKLTKFKN
jgi:hypothetical protein